MIRKILLVLSSALILTACSPSKTLPSNITGQATTQADTISIQNFAFSPTSLMVKPGQNIKVANNDSTPHTVSSDDGKSFDSGTVNAGQTGSVAAPTTPGTYTFHCGFHPSMTATLVVK